jgi:hypothetical protein
MYTNFKFKIRRKKGRNEGRKKRREEKRNIEPQRRRV